MTAADTPSPSRIQLRRVKGWRKPEGAIVVTRATKWGNPFKVVKESGIYYIDSPIDSPIGSHGSAGPDPFVDPLTEIHYWAVAYFREAITHGTIAKTTISADDLTKFALPTLDEIRAKLSGHDLACFCRPDLPCHADVLLELANA